METPAEDPLARYKNPTDAGRAPSPGPDFTGWSADDIKKERHRAGERWTDAENAKIIDLRAPPKCMPWKQVAKIVGKTPLACRLRMNQIRKQKREAAGLAGQPSAKSGRSKGKGKGKGKAKEKSATPPQAPRKLVPGPAEPQRPLPPFQPLAEASTFTPVLPPLRDLQADLQGQFANQERVPMTYWQGIPYHPQPQRPYQPSPYGIDRLSILAGAAHDADRQLPNFSSPLAFRSAEAGPRFADRHDSASVVESGRRGSNIYDLLNEENA